MKSQPYAYSGNLRLVAKGDVEHDSKTSSQLAAIALTDLSAKAGAGK
jgi:hypothetical protein